VGPDLRDGGDGGAVAVFGTLFLNRLESLAASGAYTSAEMLLACVFAPAGTAAVGAVSGLVLRRR
jgi:hypothetical protein